MRLVARPLVAAALIAASGGCTEGGGPTRPAGPGAATAVASATSAATAAPARSAREVCGRTPEDEAKDRTRYQPPPEEPPIPDEDLVAREAAELAAEERRRLEAEAARTASMAEHARAIRARAAGGVGLAGLGALEELVGKLDFSRAEAGLPSVGAVLLPELRMAVELGASCAAVATDDPGKCAMDPPEPRVSAVRCKERVAVLRRVGAMIRGGGCTQAEAERAAQLLPQAGSAALVRAACEAVVKRDPARCAKLEGVRAMCEALAGSDGAACDRARDAAACRREAAQLAAVSGAPLPKGASLDEDAAVLADAASTGSQERCQARAAARIEAAVDRALPPPAAGGG